MILSNVNIIGKQGLQHIRILNENINAVTGDKRSLKNIADEITIEFENAIAFPGLINSHDHLDFNLFPLLGNHIYKNYVDWGNDIHQQNKAVINKVLKIPKPLRIQWGVYKNLLNGVTTVVNHGEELVIPDAVIDVFQNCYSLHSVKLGKRWKYRLNKPFIKDKAFVIHIGEGTDAASKQEIDEVIRWNLFKRKLIGIHGVAMDEKQAASFKALTWCPGSNFFLLKKTAAINNLKDKTTIIFGTDATVTANWNMWHNLRLARAQQMLTDTELFNSVTSTAASVWQLNNGAIDENKIADIVIAKNKNNNDMDAFYSLDPDDILLVIHKGAIRLFDECLKEQLYHLAKEKFSTIYINESCKYVAGDLPSLMKEIRKYYPEINFPISD